MDERQTQTQTHIKRDQSFNFYGRNLLYITDSRTKGKERAKNKRPSHRSALERLSWKRALIRTGEQVEDRGNRG
jgi:hypothetical protein